MSGIPPILEPFPVGRDDDNASVDNFVAPLVRAGEVGSGSPS
ncbi:hypothetical protein AB0E56_14040 [Microbacterium sp. NPDC028030]